MLFVLIRDVRSICRNAKVKKKNDFEAQKKVQIMIFFDNNGKIACNRRNDVSSDYQV